MKINFNQDTLESLKVEIIKRYLVYAKGNKHKAARLLGISVRSIRNYVRIYEELKQFYIEPDTESRKGFYTWKTKKLKY